MLPCSLPWRCWGCWCTSHAESSRQTNSASRSQWTPLHMLEKGAMPSHQEVLQTGLASGLQREKKELSWRMEGWRPGQLDVLQVCLNTPSPSCWEKGPGVGPGQGSLAGPERFLHPYHSTKEPTSPLSAEADSWRGLSCGFWFLPMAVLSLPPRANLRQFCGFIRTHLF